MKTLINASNFKAFKLRNFVVSRTEKATTTLNGWAIMDLRTNQLVCIGGVFPHLAERKKDAESAFCDGLFEGFTHWVGAGV